MVEENQQDPPPYEAPAVVWEEPIAVGNILSSSQIYGEYQCSGQGIV